MVKIGAQRVGPIAHGEVELNRLTVFIGPNSSGKSVFAMLTYAALLDMPQEMWRARSRNPRRIPANPLASRYWRRMSDDAIADLMQPLDVFLSVYARKREALTSSDIPEPLSVLFENTVAEGLQRYGKNVCDELERCFGAQLTELHKASQFTSGDEPSSLTISSTEPEWTLDIAFNGQKPVIALVQPPSIAALLQGLPSIERAGMPVGHLDPLDERSADYIIEQLRTSLFVECFRAFPSVPYYLPAARSGILQSHKALASFVMRRASLVGIEDMNIPRLSGVITDFIALLLGMEPRRRRKQGLGRIADLLERELLKGKVSIHSGGAAYPEISYKADGIDYPLHRTSSMISEMAPVVLYLRFLLDPNDLLILEEPESHLHPSSQLCLAKVLSAAINEGLSVLLTTHSDYFLAQLNNFIREGAITANRLSSADEINTALMADDVRAYLFDVSTSEGTTVQSVSVSARDGIAEDEFGRVAEALYSQTVELDRRLIDE